MHGVQGGPQDPGFAAFRGVADGNDHVGKLAEAEKDVTDVGALELHLLKPGLLGIVASHQVVGTGVADLPARGVDEAEVHEAGELAAHDLEDALQVGVVGQFLEIVGRGDEAHGRGALGQEELEGVLGLAQQGPHGRLHLGRHGVLVLVIVDAGQGQERQQGYQGHEGDDLAPQHAVAPGRVDLRAHVGLDGAQGGGEDVLHAGSPARS